MRTARPLPIALTRAPFAVSRGRELGVTVERMRRRDLHRPFHGVRTGDDIADLDVRCRAALLRLAPTAFVCGVTAALLLDVPLPRRLETASTIHVALPRPGRAPRGAGISGHSFGVPEHAICIVAGVRMTRPERTWCDLAAVLDVDELVIAGDHLARWDLRLSTTSRLAAAAAATSAGRRGRPRLVEAAGHLNGRSQSAGETRLRLLLEHAGFGGLAVNHEIRLEGVATRYRVDLALPDLKVAIEYQGGYHAGLDQYRADQTRLGRLRAHGWLVIEVNAGDLRDARELVDRIRRLIAQHGLVAPNAVDRSRIVGLGR
jgi:very-short-patch-repair endonuclease